MSKSKWKDNGLLLAAIWTCTDKANVRLGQ